MCKYFISSILCLLTIACSGRHPCKSISILLDNSKNLFQADSEMLADAVRAAVSYRLEQDRSGIKINDKGIVIKIELLSDKTTFNRSWLMGDNYDRKVDFNLHIGNHVNFCSVIVNRGKDGAIDRFVGHVSGLGSHPGRSVFPSQLGPIIDSIADEVCSRIRFAG